MKTIRALIVLIIVGAGAIVAYAYSGWYDISVGTGHNAVTEWYLETLRERSIEARAKDIRVPNLDDEAMIRAGSMHYDDGCAACHGKPGEDPTDVFDPRPPALARHAEEPAEAYWIIQNGIKMSGMPIKGRGHSEDEVWSIVAFLQEMPELTPGEYKAMVEEAKAEGSHSHDHDGGGEDQATAGAESPGAAVDAFHQALMSGNGEGALALLHENATILEGGHLQTKSEYASGHLASDMEFLSGATSEPVSRSATGGDSQATVTTEYRVTVDGDEGTEEHRVAETASLVGTESGWLITHISWGSASPGDESESGAGQPESPDQPQS